MSQGRTRDKDDSVKTLSIYRNNKEILHNSTDLHTRNNDSPHSLPLPDLRRRQDIRDNRRPRYFCNVCDKNYSTSSNLARHRQTHRSPEDTKARKCPDCNKVYVSMPAYSMHLRTHGSGHLCRQCGKLFSSPWLLKGHLR